MISVSAKMLDQEVMEIFLRSKSWLSAGKKFGGGDNRPLFLKQYAVVSIVLSVVFENFGRGVKIVLPPPPVAESQKRSQEKGRENES